jgi:molecular chaperone GrpE
MNGSTTDSGDRVPAAGELDELRSALEEEQQRSLRLLAEFDNFRRRLAREHKAAADAGRRDALVPLLGVLDALEQALAAGSSDANFYEGVAATSRLFVNALKSAGAEPIPALGEPFDPTVHNAVATVTSDTVKPGTIVREQRSGWRLGNELLRPAEVVVSVADGATDPWQ